MHFTHVDNLVAIASSGYLKADSIIRSESISINECGNTDIKSRRRTVQVAVPPGGVVADYVPFYFAPRSPMMYSIYRGNVATYHEGQDPLVYMWTYVSIIDRLGLPWIGSDGNCAHSVTALTNSWSQLDSMVDWQIMKEKYWRDTPEDGDRMRRRMAEFLIHQRCPISAMQGFVTRTESVAEQVRQYTGNRYRVEVDREWYY